MSPLERVQNYVTQVYRRMRWLVLGHGVAVIAAVALGATLGLVVLTNWVGFSSKSLLAARVALGLVLAVAVWLGLAGPLRRLTRRRAVEFLERRVPALEERLLTLETPVGQSGLASFAEFVAREAERVLSSVMPSQVVRFRALWVSLAIAVWSLGLLLWLGLWGPGFLGYGVARLWGMPRPGVAQPFYELVVQPGNARVRAGLDQLVTARPMGYQASGAWLWVRWSGSAKWDQFRMEPAGPAFEFLLTGLDRSLEYYVQAGRLKSRIYRLTVVDLPRVERIRVRYRYPEWAGEPERVEEDTGDVRAVEGTEATVEIRTDRPLEHGQLVLDDGTTLQLKSSADGWNRAQFRITRDGSYYVAAVDGGERVRLSEDFFIEAMEERPPVITVRRPGRDYKASPIEEVTVEVEAEDDFGVRELTLHYSVNGAPEQSLRLFSGVNGKRAAGSTTLSLEELKLQPGDVISFYAVARDARAMARSDIYFIEAQPFEREYRQSQQSPSGMSGAGEGMENQISQRQKEIIAATWNLLNDQQRSRERAQQDSEFLSDVQAKLAEQVRSLARRLRARELAGINEEFRSFAENMDAAAQAMGQAAERLKKQQWRQALEPEQQALRHLLRAESLFRQIQVAFGARGGSGGRGGAARDLESLFELELDPEKNQYETGQRAFSAGERSRELDAALERLRQLARRQQELARQPITPRSLQEQRWQQELLRREAERLEREMESLLRAEQLSRGGSARGGSAGAADQQERIQRALQQLRQAMDDMRRALAGRQSSQEQLAQAQRAAERLREATELLEQLRYRQGVEQVDEIARRASRLAEQQRQSSEQLRQLYRDHKALGGTGEGPSRVDPRELSRLAEQRVRMAEELGQLERDMQRALRQLASSQPQAAARLREALGDVQQAELPLRLKTLAEWIRRGMGPYAWLREAPVTAGLQRLAEQLQEVQQLARQGTPQQDTLERALARVQQLRRQIEELAGRGQATGGTSRAGAPQAGNRLGPGDDVRGPLGGRMPYGGTGPIRSYSAMNPGIRELPDVGVRADAEVWRQWERVYREQVRQLEELARAHASDRAVAEDVRELIEAMKRLDPARFPGNPRLVEQLRTQILPVVEQLELKLRRQYTGASAAAQVGAVEPSPTGYAEAVAEYFRRLSRVVR